MTTKDTRIDELTGAEYQLNWQIKDKKENIVSAAKWLRGELDDLINRLSTDGRVINSLGVLQGNGPALDRLIGEYATLLEVRKTMFPKDEGKKS